jgi:membrane protein involved in colicin uptake
MHYYYQQFCSNYAKTKSARLEREEEQSKFYACWEAAKRQRLAAAKKAKQEAEKAKQAKQEAEKAKQEAENKALLLQWRVAQAKEWAAQKIQEEKVASERLAAQRELADLFAPQPPLPAWHR